MTDTIEMMQGVSGNQSIHQKLDLILGKLNDIEQRLSNIEKHVGKMDTHINFVESIYDNIKSPFHRVMNMIQNTSRIPLLQ